MKRHISAVAAASLCLLCACGSDNNTPASPSAAATEQAQTTAAPVTTAQTESQTAAETAAETAEETEGIPAAGNEKISFAERAVGTYYCNVNYGAGEERLKMEITDVSGNLYAICSLGGDTETPPAEEDSAYSLWMMEIIPEEAGAFLTYTDKVEAGVLKYSNMSNAGRYWGVPDTGTLTLTDNGIIFENIDLAANAPDKEITTELERYEGKSVFDIGYEVTEQDRPDEIYGLWRYTEDLGDTTTDTFVKFDKGGSDYYEYMTIYRKETGCEAMLQKGGFCFDDYDEINAMLYQVAAEPIKIEWNVTVKDGRLTVRGSDIAAEEELVFERVPDTAVPLVMLADADEINRVSNGMDFTDISGSKRTVTLQFKMCDDIENNGGYFVRLGDLIFYRELDESTRGIRSMFGDFLYTYPEAEKGSRICWYDRRTGETGLAFEDEGFGPLYYMNGLFYTQYTPDEKTIAAYAGSGVEIDATARHIRAYTPDGTYCDLSADMGSYYDALEPSFNTETYINGVADNGRYLLLNSYLPNSEPTDTGNYYSAYCRLYDGTAYDREIKLSETETMEGHSFINDSFIYAKYDYESSQFSFVQYDPEDDRETILGTAGYTGEAAEYGVCVCEQIIADGDDIYFAVAGYIGDSLSPDGFAVYKAAYGKENSLETVQNGLPEGFEEITPVVSVENGELSFSEFAKGKTALSERTKGDLVYYDTPDSKTVLIENYITKDIYKNYGSEVKKGETLTILQAAPFIDGAVYVIEADSTFDPDYENGILSEYYMKNMRWLRIVPGEEPVVLYEFPPVP